MQGRYLGLRGAPDYKVDKPGKRGWKDVLVSRILVATLAAGFFFGKPNLLKSIFSRRRNATTNLVEQEHI